MKTNLSDLIAALPQEEDGSEVLSSTEAQERLQAIFSDLARAFRELVRKRYTAGHPVHIYLHRACFGLGALLLRLRCRVDVRKIRTLELERRAAGGAS